MNMDWNTLWGAGRSSSSGSSDGKGSGAYSKKTGNRILCKSVCADGTSPCNRLARSKDSNNNEPRDDGGKTDGIESSKSVLFVRHDEDNLTLKSASNSNNISSGAGSDFKNVPSSGQISSGSAKIASADSAKIPSVGSTKIASGGKPIIASAGPAKNANAGPVKNIASADIGSGQKSVVSPDLGQMKDVSSGKNDGAGSGQMGDVGSGQKGNVNLSQKENAGTGHAGGASSGQTESAGSGQKGGAVKVQNVGPSTDFRTGAVSQPKNAVITNQKGGFVSDKKVGTVPDQKSGSGSWGIKSGDGAPKSSTMVSNKLDSKTKNTSKSAPTSPNINNSDSDARSMFKVASAEGDPCKGSLKESVFRHLIKEMDKAADNVLVRQGKTVRSFKDGVNRLSKLKVEDLIPCHANEALSDRIANRIHPYMSTRTPANMKRCMRVVVGETSDYLSAEFLQPDIVKICRCKCKKHIRTNNSCNCTLKDELRLIFDNIGSCYKNNKISYPLLINETDNFMNSSSISEYESMGDSIHNIPRINMKATSKNDWCYSNTNIFNQNCTPSLLQNFYVRRIGT